MKPEHFIREFGVDKARQVVEGAPEGYKGYNVVINQYTRGVWFSRDVMLSDLKRLVESLDRIDKCGGLYGFKTYCNGDYSQEDLQAIRDHESIYGGGDA
ncbi:hypothetical protein [Acinetobacter baumannii]|uniref:hypothetical protein n=1 Tax=Acinetobacter baumannii TaxID=470 RepID=UPI00090B9167|nr:hypothetical protein [Acinetobacter baumannii]APJ18525.1 hypothetical protein BS064_05235 [Acinetobacter baumannii]EKX8116155.1 hypothetical protein [Acinetobacter baumannii]MDI6494117.1 hypothetical protein [Acinetobacter baumannii]HCT8642641.1 hypothetical protein [Acinetobacter baumannii]HCT8645147.1 hypothetical protein [Acinetobacter baumannii]